MTVMDEHLAGDNPVCPTCDHVVDLRFAHVTVARNVEIQTRPGTDAYVDQAAVVDQWHVDCAPPTDTLRHLIRTATAAAAGGRR